MELGIAHWLYLLTTALIILSMVLRKGVVILAIMGTFLVAWAYKGSFLSGLMAIFNANLVAAKGLFSIFLIITFMVALLSALQEMGADKRMVAPWQKIMVNGYSSFFIIFLATYIFSLFFWPTPAVALICALLVPPAIRAGLPAMAAAMAVSFAGQGMALSSDYIMQVAPGISATAAGVTTEQVADKAMLLSLITGLCAIVVTAFMFRNKMRKPGDPAIESEMAALKGDKDDDSAGKIMGVPCPPGMANAFAIIVSAVMLGVMVLMFYDKLSSGSSRFAGGDGAAFIGGVAALILIVCTAARNRMSAMETIAEHLTKGFTFAFKTMGVVIPIAGFFFLGSSDFTPEILSLSSDAAVPAFLFDLVSAVQEYIPHSPLITSFGLLLVGIVSGLDGSGFSGLPLTGALSGALSAQSGVDVGTLAAIGQMGSIWAGGGTLIAWSSLVAIAGFCGLNAFDLVRKSFIPVVAGLAVSTVIGSMFF